MALELYRDKNHACLMFTDLIEEDGQAVQANQFLIVDDDTGAIIDPGGNLAYSELYLGMTRHFPPSKLSAILASSSQRLVNCSKVLASAMRRFSRCFSWLGD